MKATTEGSPDALFTRNRWTFSIGTLGRDMVYALVSLYLIVFLTEVLDASDTFMWVSSLRSRGASRSSSGPGVDGFPTEQALRLGRIDKRTIGVGTIALVAAPANLRHPFGNQFHCGSSGRDIGSAKEQAWPPTTPTRRTAQR